MGRRHYRNRRESIRSKQRHIKRRKHNGWGMGLYRNTRDGKIAGVCAGLADYWDVENWVVRLLAIAAFLFTGSLAFWAYIAGWVLLAPRRRADDLDAWSRAEDQPLDDVDLEYDERAHDYRPRRMFRYGDSASVRLQRAKARLDAAMQRVEDMESYVTSRQFELNRKISEL